MLRMLRSGGSPIVPFGGRPFSDFERFFEEPIRGLRAIVAESLPVRVVEHPEHYEITAEVPGARREDLKLDIDEHVITLEHVPAAKEKEADESKAGRVIFNERSDARTRRILRFEAPLAGEGHEARLENGVLTVRLLKRVPASTSRSLEIL